MSQQGLRSPLNSPSLSTLRVANKDYDNNLLLLATFRAYTPTIHNSLSLHKFSITICWPKTSLAIEINSLQTNLLDLSLHKTKHSPNHKSWNQHFYVPYIQLHIKPFQSIRITFLHNSRILNLEQIPRTFQLVAFIPYDFVLIWGSHSC